MQLLKMGVTNAPPKNVSTTDIALHYRELWQVGNIFRKNCTVQKIKKCGKACTQVIVISHNGRFINLIWDRLAHVPALWRPG